MRTAVAVLPFALCLAAVPALAKESPRAAAITAHLESLLDENYNSCLDSDHIPAQQRIVMCRAAAETLDAKRKAASGLGIGERTNFDFAEAVLLSGLALSYFEVDGKRSARVCSTIERVWLLRQSLLTVPEEELPASAYRAYHAVPADLVPLVQHCRSEFGTPQGAAPLG